MKLLIVLTFFLLGTNVTFAQNDPLDDIVAALKSGNANTIANFVESSVEITMPDKRETYTKTQAVIILKDFFNNNTFKKFSIDNKIYNNGVGFCNGILVTSKANYYVTFYLRKNKNKIILQEISFENKK